MFERMFSKILAQYGVLGNFSAVPFGNGLINNTWHIEGPNGHAYILQRINDQVFKNPNHIAENIHLIETYLKINAPGYLFVAPLKTSSQQYLVNDELDGYFRLFNFIKGSKTYEQLNTPSLAFDAATCFGKFTRLLSGLDTHQLHITIPDFHNLSLRYRQFKTVLGVANEQKIKESESAIEFLEQSAYLVNAYETITANPEFKVRTMHHDTKISNVLFDQAGKSLCVIDLDTVMPGYFISDVGDMMRNYLSPANEEETDFSKIDVREAYLKAIISGYLSEMDAELTSFEKKHFVFAGQFMIYMQALRFLTDHLNNDAYYGAKYPGHNLNRALNQITLLQKLNPFAQND